MLLEQAILLISQPPDNLAYHLITLLALQVSFSIAFWQWRHVEDDRQVWRLWAAAAGIFTLRLVLAVYQFNTPVDEAPLILPPVERAVDLGTTLLLIWGMLPSPRNAPRLWDSLLLISVLAVAIGFFFAIQDWPPLLALDVKYGSTNQAMIWALVHVVTVTLAVAWLIIHRSFDWLLRLLLLLTLLATQLMHAVNFVPPTLTLIDVTGDVAGAFVPFWARLGYIIVFPLLAAVAYRQNLVALLDGTRRDVPQSEMMRGFLELSGAVLKAEDIDERGRRAASLAGALTGANFSAVALLLPDENPLQPGLRLLAAPDPLAGRPAATWQLALTDWPAMQMALRRGEIVELSPQGMGARQLTDFSNEINLGAIGPMLVAPLIQATGELGVLLLAEKANVSAWPAEIKDFVPILSAYLVEVLRLPAADQAPGGDAQRRGFILGSAAAGAAREEVQALRESLRAAEEALALASAGEAGLSTEWVTRALTQYSSELEEAQRRIGYLETQLNDVVFGSARDTLILLSEELRTPVTAIETYVGVLMAESNGNLPFEHRHLLERIKASTRRMDTLISRLDRHMSRLIQRLEHPPQANLLQVIEAAVEAQKIKLGEKRIALALALPDDLALLPIDSGDLFQILAQLLARIIDQIPEKSPLTLSAAPMSPAEERLVKLEIRAPGPLPVLGQRSLQKVRSTIGAEGQQLPTSGRRSRAQVPSWEELVGRYNGRFWVENRQGEDSALILLLPAHTTA